MLQDTKGVTCSGWLYKARTRPIWDFWGWWRCRYWEVRKCPYLIVDCGLKILDVRYADILQLVWQIIDTTTIFETCHIYSWQLLLNKTSNIHLTSNWMMIITIPTTGADLASFTSNKICKHDVCPQETCETWRRPIILSFIISVDIGMLDDIWYLILKPIWADKDNVPNILCISTWCIKEAGYLTFN